MLVIKGFKPQGRALDSQTPSVFGSAPRGEGLNLCLASKNALASKHFCSVDKKAKYQCEICAFKTDDLDAHEEWDFDIESKTQTLKNIIALCSRCHGVKHMRNSERMGYGENAKRHFLKVNKCSDLDFAKHYFEAQELFDERNSVLRWIIKADLYRFGGRGVAVRQRYIPYINNPYEGLDWGSLECDRTRANSNSLLRHELGNEYVLVSLSDKNCYDGGAKYFSSFPMGYIGAPKIQKIEVDNYQGTITIVCDDIKKIEMLLDEKVIKRKYNVVGKFVKEFSVEGLEGKFVRFRLYGSNGITCTQSFALKKVDNAKGGML